MFENIKGKVKGMSKGAGIGTILGGMSALIPDIPKEDAIAILAFRNKETELFAKLLVAYKASGDLEIDEAYSPNSDSMNKEMVKTMITNLSRSMPGLSKEQENILSAPNKIETRMMVDLINQFQDKIPEEYKNILVKNMKYLAVGIEKNEKLRGIFNNIASILSSRDYDRIVVWLNSLDKNSRIFALKMAMKVGKDVETSDEFRLKYNEILNRFDEHYKSIQNNIR